jgi:hypothetical protein
MAICAPVTDERGVITAGRGGTMQEEELERRKEPDGRPSL